MNIALISPTKNAYSETFIQAHIQHLLGNVHHFYGGFVPTTFEGKDFSQVPLPRLQRWRQSIGTRLGLDKYKPPHIYHLEKLMIEKEIQVVMAEYGFTGAEMLPFCKSMKMPILVHFHGYDAYRNDLLTAYLHKYKDLFVYASAIIVVSEDMKSQLIQLGCPENKIELNPYGVNPDFLLQQPMYHSHQFACVGRFVDKKAPYLTLMAFKEVFKKYPDATLTMVGEGELLNTCQNLAKQWCIAHAVKFVGKKTPLEVMEILSNSFCFLQHSITAQNGDKEGTPLAVLEASAMGLPVIATKHAGIKEAVLHGKSGFLVDEHDVKMMSAYMLQLYENRDLAENMGREGKQYIQVHYNLGKHINKLDILIQQIAKI